MSFSKMKYLKNRNHYLYSTLAHMSMLRYIRTWRITGMTFISEKFIAIISNQQKNQTQMSKRTNYKQKKKKRMKDNL